MIWCRYQQSGGLISYGLVENDIVTQVHGTPFGEYTIASTQFALDAVKLLVPVIPGTFYCGGLNYQRHITQMSKKYGIEIKMPTTAPVSYRTNNALIAHDEDIVKPKDASPELQYEGELVAVIGKKGKHLTPQNALEHVLGYTIGNDVSERFWQMQDLSILLHSKNADTFKPMGPWIVTGLDPKDMKTTIRLNDRVVETFDTGNMLFDVPTYLCEITRHSTIYPGDVVWFGTDGVPENMTPGDTIEIEISGIGVLRNKVVAET